MKKLVIGTLFLWGMVIPQASFAEEVSPTAYVFGESTCELCKTEVKWLFDEGIHYKFLNIGTDAQAKEAYDALLAKHDLQPIEPLTVIGPEIIAGYENEKTTGHDITTAITKAKKSDIATVEAHLSGAPKMEIKEAVPCEGLGCETTSLQAMTPIPLLGLVNLRDTSFSLVSFILGSLTLTRLLSVGLILVSLGLLVLMPEQKYVAMLGLMFLLLEAGGYYYFFNGGYRSISRFVIEASYADVLRSSVGLFARQWYISLYTGIALIDNVLATAAAVAAFPYLERFEDKRPGSTGMLSVALLFIGGACIAYFIKFS